MDKDIYKAINNASNKVNEMAQKLDSFFNARADTNASNIDLNAGGVDGLGEVVDINAGAVDGLATVLDEISTALDDVGVMLADFDERITNLESEVIK